METLRPALGRAWKYALKVAPSLCLLKEKVTNITFPEEVSFMTGDEPETGRPHHLRSGRHIRGRKREIALEERPQSVLTAR